MSRLPVDQPLPMRVGHLPLADLIDLYMAHYAGRDTTRVQRLSYWKARVGAIALQDLTDDHVHAALEDLATRPARYWAGRGPDGQPIYHFKKKTMSPATVNRYATALAAVITWSIRKRIAPKGLVHPCRSVERRPETAGRTRFLSNDEQARLLEACRASSWPELYLLVLLALTTGARKSELLGLRWRDVDLVRAVAEVGRTKNGDARVLPLVPAVVEMLKGNTGKPDALVFAATKRPDRPFTFEPRWKEAMERARIRNFRFHDLRHTTASTLARNGATLLEIADVLGHRQLQMSKRYAHLSTSHKAGLVNRVFADVQ